MRRACLEFGRRVGWIYRDTVAAGWDNFRAARPVITKCSDKGERWRDTFWFSFYILLKVAQLRARVRRTWKVDFSVYPFPAVTKYIRYVYRLYTAARKRHPTTSPTLSINRKNLNFGRASFITLTKEREIFAKRALFMQIETYPSGVSKEMQISTKKIKLYLSDTLE